MLRSSEKAKFDPRFVLPATLIARINPSDNGAKMELRIIGRRWIPNSGSKMESCFPKSKMDFIKAKLRYGWGAYVQWFWSYGVMVSILKNVDLILQS